MIFNFKISLFFTILGLGLSCSHISEKEERIKNDEIRKIYQYYERLPNFENELTLRQAVDLAEGIDAKVSTEVAYMVQKSTNGKPGVLKRLNEIINSSYFDELSPLAKFYIHYYNGYFLGYFYKPKEAFQQYSLARSIIDNDLEKYPIESEELQLLLLRITSFFSIGNDVKRIENITAELERAERLNIPTKVTIQNYNLAYLYSLDHKYRKSIQHAYKSIASAGKPIHNRVYSATMGVLADDYTALDKKDSVLWIENMIKEQYKNKEIDSIMYVQFLVYNTDNMVDLISEDEIEKRFESLFEIYPNICKQNYFRGLLYKKYSEYLEKKGKLNEEKATRKKAITFLSQCDYDDFFSLEELANHYNRLIDINKENDNYKELVSLYKGLERVNATNDEKVVTFSEMINYFNDLEVKYAQRALNNQKQKNKIINKVNILYGALTLLFLASSIYIGRLLYQKIKYQETLKTNSDQLKTQNETISHQNEKMLKLVEALQENNENLENFARIMAHDIKAPIASIKDAINFLRTKYNDTIHDEDVEVFQYLNQSTANLNNMINVLLDYSSNKNINRNEEVNLSQEIKRVLSNLQSEINASNAQITFSDNLPTIIANETLIEQLLLNIIGNAIKYRKKGVVPIITIEYLPFSEDYVQIMIHDNGIGIPEHQQSSIFQAYNSYRNSNEIEGNGIGLAVSKKIVEEFGGEIWVESEPDKGSTFYFTLPTVEIEEKV